MFDNFWTVLESYWIPIVLLCSASYQLQVYQRQQRTLRVCPRCGETFLWREINQRKLTNGARGLAHFDCPRCDERIALPLDPRETKQWKLPES